MIPRASSARLRLCVSARGRWAHAFTLIELIFVLAIICITLAVIAPEFSGFLRGQTIINTSNKLVALARHGRALAISEGRVYRLNVDTNSGAYWLEAQQGADFKELGTADGQHFQMPEGTKSVWLNEAGAPVAASAPAGAAGANLPAASSGAFSLGGGNAQGKTASATQGVQFFPDGRCETMTLRLTGKNGNEINLGAPSETEMWRVTREGQL